MSSKFAMNVTQSDMKADEVILCCGDKEKHLYARPQGEWINHRNDYGHNIADCSLCGKAMQWHDEDEAGIPRYCWYCGADMRKGKADNERVD